MPLLNFMSVGGNQEKIKFLSQFPCTETDVFIFLFFIFSMNHVDDFPFQQQKISILKGQPSSY